MAHLTRSNSAQAKKAEKEHKFIKRPLRGYHKFKNGLLNVTPKGGEKEVNEAKQRSPLLRLPAEIRNAIGAFLLGGHVMRTTWCRQKRTYKMTPSPAERSGVALLRVCRQVYAEAAGMPLSLNLFSCHYSDNLRQVLKRFKPCQRKLIASAELEVPSPFVFNHSHTHREICGIFKFLPALKTFRILVYKEDVSSRLDCVKDEEKEREVCERVKADPVGALVDFGV